MSDRPDDAVLESLMLEAIGVAQRGIAAGQSPFGAVIADRTGRILAAEHNRVRASHDATAHAEIAAIRTACAALNNHSLKGYMLATTCEPCPMCAGAIHWAQLDGVVFGATIADARQADFNELAVSIRQLYKEGSSRVVIYPPMLQAPCAALFDAWRGGPNPEPY